MQPPDEPVSPQWSPPSAAPKPVASPPGASSFVPIRVLIVEDSEFDARVLASELRAGGYQPTWKRVASRDALAEILGAEAWELILCDHQMPGFSAPEALRCVQETGLDIPFIIVSAGIGEDEAVRAMKDGAHDFLIKGKLARLVPAVQRELREAAVRAARRKAEASLRESELRHRLVWENSTDAVLLIADDGTVRFANPAASAIFGWNLEELVGLPYTVLQATGSGDASWLEAAGSGDIRRLIDTRGIRKDGTVLDLDVAVSVLRLNGERISAAFIRDITERKRFLMELAKSRREFAAAREIQQRLFPTAPPAIPGFDIAGVSYPADAAGGDYFDYIRVHGGALAVVVADVSGHGIGPALLMSEGRTALRLVAQTESDPAGILTVTNRVLADDLGGHRYITLLLVRLDPVARTLVHGSAGHPPGLVFDSAGNVKAELRRTGPPLGQRREFAYGASGQVTLASGDVVLLTTDGAMEAMRGREIFGRDRLLATIRRHLQGSAEDILGAVCSDVREFCGQNQADDLTVVVIKVI